jgi:hypothetical protein
VSSAAPAGVPAPRSSPKSPAARIADRRTTALPPGHTPGTNGSRLAPSQHPALGPHDEAARELEPVLGRALELVRSRPAGHRSDVRVVELSVDAVQPARIRGAVVVNVGDEVSGGLRHRPVLRPRKPGVGLADVPCGQGAGHLSRPVVRRDVVDHQCLVRHAAEAPHALETAAQFVRPVPRAHRDGEPPSAPRPAAGGAEGLSHDARRGPPPHLLAELRHDGGPLMVDRQCPLRGDERAAYEAPSSDTTRSTSV